MNLSELLRLLFPPRCPFCGRMLREGENEICAQCMGSLRLIPSGRVKPPEWADSSVGALWYEAGVRSAVHRLKFRGRQSAAEPFGRLLSYQVRAQMDEPFDFVTWVPTGAGNLSKRGYDHARLIAEETAAWLELPAEPALRRVRDTKPMFGLTAAERRANILDAFAVLPAAPIDGARLLIVDDVLTTGATLAECARVLKEAGAARVCTATVAVAKKTR